MFPFGRLHPLLLHLPIGSFFLAVIVYFALGKTEKRQEENTFRLILDISVLVALLSAISGLFLSIEPEYDASLVAFHRNTSTIFAVSLYGLSAFLSMLPRGIASLLLVLELVLLVVAGHYGGELTHGKNFIFQAKIQPQQQLDSNSSVYLIALQPILESKCTSCHNAEKAKGMLVLTDSSGILKGGKGGKVVIAGDAQASPLIQRLHLDLDDEKHMPPLGKQGLSPEEIKTLTLWIDRGSSFGLKPKDLGERDTLRVLCEKALTLNKQPAKSYTFAFADKKLIQKLNTPYRSVKLLANNSPALIAAYYLPRDFNASKIKELLEVKQQLVQLNLAKMPIKDAEMELIAEFKQLERLNLSQTQITNSGLMQLKPLTQLEELSLAFTNISEIPEFFFKPPFRLKKLFLYNTRTNPVLIQDLQSKYREIDFFSIEKDTALLALTPPLLENENVIVGPEDSIVLLHKINGVKIKYSLDGSEPDSLRGLDYIKPIALKNALDIKAFAYKSGWLKSPTETFTLFKKGLVPKKCDLVTTANSQYPGSSALTFTNESKAPIKNLKDQNWIAFRENHFRAIFSFDQAKPIHKISLCYGVQIPSYVFPPVWVKIFGGPSPANMQLLKLMKLPQISPKDKDLVKSDAIHIELAGKPFPYYAIEGMNLQKIPTWHAGKGEKGWLFIDEIFFYE